MAKHASKSRPHEYQRIRVLFPDHLGLARGKYLPAAHGATHANHCIGIFALTFDRTMVPAPGGGMLEGFPDCTATFSLDDVRPGWEPETGVVVADLELDGKPLAISPRHTLRKAVADWQALGYRANVGIELEAYIMAPDGNGGWKPWDTPGAYVYGTGTACDPVGLFEEIMRTAEASGLPVESINSEFDTPQWELTLVFGEALAAVDNIFLFKVMAREVAARHGLLLTYLGRPFVDRAGSGLHVNFSLVDKKGKNAFGDASSKDGLSKLAHHCIGGLIAHHEGMSAMCAPTVNAYKRLRAGQLAGYWANWGYDHRGVTVRVPAARGQSARLEHRMPDGSASPYLATAAVLQAARLGHVNGTGSPVPEKQDCLEHQSATRHTPDDLGRALEAFEADKELYDAIGPEMSALFVAIKQAEWQKFRVAVTDWELDHYLPFL